MSQEQALMLCLKVVLISGETASLLWVAVYSYLARWWARGNPVGGTVVRLALYLAALLVPSILSLFLHLNRNTSLAAGWFDVTVFAVVAVELFRRVPLWVKLHMDKDGRQSYAGLLPFAAQVIRRHGRPVWKDETPQEPETGETLSPPRGRRHLPAAPAWSPPTWRLTAGRSWPSRGMPAAVTAAVHASAGGRP